LPGRPDIQFINLTVRINHINVCEEHFFGVRALLVGTMKTIHGMVLKVEVSVLVLVLVLVDKVSALVLVLRVKILVLVVVL